jgi:hypothetical protein
MLWLGGDILGDLRLITWKGEIYSNQTGLGQGLQMKKI